MTARWRGFGRQNTAYDLTVTAWLTHHLVTRVCRTLTTGNSYFGMTFVAATFIC